MANLNPLDNDLALMLKNLNTRLSALENTRQPYVSDWIQVADSFSVRNVWSLNYNNLNPILTSYLRAGTWIRFKQTGDVNYRYAIIGNTKTTSGVLGIIYAGYSFTNSVNITEFWYSNAFTPFGAPFSYDIGPVMQVPNQLGSTFSIVSSSIKLVNTGNLITLVGDTSVAVTSGATVTAFFAYFPIIDAAGTYAVTLATGNLAGPIGLGIQSNSLATVQTIVSTTTGITTLALGFELPVPIAVGSNISVAIELSFVLLS